MKLSLAPTAPLPNASRDLAGYDVEAQLPPLVRAVFALVEKLHRRIVAARRDAADAEVLAHMSDRELADIGLSRSDAQRVGDPAFAADYAASRGLKWF